MAEGKKFVPGKGMIPAGKAAAAKKEAIPPKKNASAPQKKEMPGGKKPFEKPVKKK